MAKKRKRAPAFPEKAELLQYIKLATKLADIGAEKAATQLDPIVKKMIEAVVAEELCEDGKDHAASIIHKVTGAKYDDVRKLMGDGDSGEAVSYPTGACVMLGGKPQLSLGFDPCGDREWLNAKGERNSNIIEFSHKRATDAEIAQLTDAQLRRLLVWMRSRD